MVPGTPPPEPPCETVPPALTGRPPTADPGGPYRADDVHAGILEGTASFDTDGAVVEGAWDFGGGTAGTGPAVGHSHPGPGEHVVTPTVSGGVGDADWVDQVPSLLADWALVPPKPSWLIAPRYEYWWPEFTGWSVRTQAYDAVLNGSAGIAYGDRDVYAFPPDSRDRLDREGAEDVVHLRAS